MTTPESTAGRVGFAVGTGRCGTKFIARAAELEPEVAASHERNPYNETFHRYCQWYRLPVDGEGFLHQIGREIAQDLAGHAFSLEASAYLSLSVLELYERFGAKFLLLVRAPEKVVNSFYHKGWYASPAVRRDPDLAPGYQENESFHHVLARFMPSGEKFLPWNAMTRVGKLAWYWNAMNGRILEQFAALPQEHWRVEKIEELDYARYCDAAAFLGYPVTISEPTYEALRAGRPNSFQGVPTTAGWSEQEIAEFESEAAPLARELGYEYRVSLLSAAEPLEPAPVPAAGDGDGRSKNGLVERLRSSLFK